MDISGLMLIISVYFSFWLCKFLFPHVVFNFSLCLQTLFFLWFALSGWMFRFLIFGTWILPLAGPLLIGTVANNFIIKVKQVALTFEMHWYLLITWRDYSVSSWDGDVSFSKYGSVCFTLLLCRNHVNFYMLIKEF